MTRFDYPLGPVRCAAKERVNYPVSTKHTGANFEVGLEVTDACSAWHALYGFPTSDPYRAAVVASRAGTI